MKKLLSYSWLTASEYGETDALTSNKDWYTEKMTSFTRNGGIKALQRYGKLSSGTYGYVDNLSISYKGNRIAGVSDGAPVVTQNGSMDFPGGSTSSAFTYNAFGALASDASRGITSISYDNFGNPKVIQFSGSRRTSNVYSATGEKLKTTSGFVYIQAADPAVPFETELETQGESEETTTSDLTSEIAQDVTEYHGPVIYRNGAIDMVLFPGGYATINGTAATFHYYTQDYLGNNRAVINGTTGAIEQTIAYYPFGAVIADLGTPTTGQPYKFGGKELMTANGLNEYDFGARNYYPAVPGFTKPDQMAEKFYWLSPYIYCANNPVNRVDPTGKIIEMPKGTSTKQLFTVMWNLMQLTDDRLVYSTQKDGTIRIKIASLGKGRHPAGTRLIRRLNSSKKTVTIVETNKENNNTKDKNKKDATNWKGSDTEIKFNPDFNPDIPVKKDKSGKVTFSKRPSYIGLGHELGHADRSMRGAAFEYDIKYTYSYIDANGKAQTEPMRMEEAANIGLGYNDTQDITENDLRKEHGLPLRGAYGN